MNSGASNVRFDKSIYVRFFAPHTTSLWLDDGFITYFESSTDLNASGLNETNVLFVTINFILFTWKWFDFFNYCLKTAPLEEQAIIIYFQFIFTNQI